MKALITGANKGIGFGIAEALGKRGIEILVGARSEQLGNQAVAELKKAGITASFIKIDLNDFTSIHQAADQVSALDYLINNAGIAGNLASERGPLDMEKSPFDYTTADLQQTIETNFLGTHEVIKSFLPKLTPTAKILNVTVPVSSTYWQPLAYVTSKAAQNVMTMAFGHEFEKQGSQQQIFGVLPGAVATSLNGMTANDNYNQLAIKTPSEAGENIVSFLFDGKNHNGHIVEFDGKEITTYEGQLFD